MVDKISPFGKIVQGTVVALAIDPDGPLAGVILMGESGSGKSDLALRMIEQCPWRRTRLVSDDAVMIVSSDGGVTAHRPEKIRDMLEVRGVGIADFTSIAQVKLKMICRLGERPSRLPAEKYEKLVAHAGETLPVMRLEGFENSAVLKIRQAVRSFLARLFEEARQDGSSGRKRHETE